MSEEVTVIDRQHSDLVSQDFKTVDTAYDCLIGIWVW